MGAVITILSLFLLLFYSKTPQDYIYHGGYLFVGIVMLVLAYRQNKINPKAAATWQPWQKVVIPSFLVIVLVLIALGAITTLKKKSNDNVLNQQNAYPEDVRVNYLNECSKIGGTNNICLCSFQYTRNKYIYADFRKLTANEIRQLLQEAYSSCKK